MSEPQSQPQPGSVEVRRLRRLLREIVKIARDASLTGTLEKGAPASAQQYNSVLRRLEHLGELSPGLFPSLKEEGVSFDEIGVAAAQLASYLDTDEPEPRGAWQGGSQSFNLKVGAKDLNELKELGQAIRENLPEWLRGGPGGPPPPWVRHESPRPGTPPPPPPAPEPPATEAALRDIERRIAEVSARLQSVAEQLRRPDLGDLQRADLADQLARLGQEQARLAREQATLRDRFAV